MGVVLEAVVGVVVVIVVVVVGLKIKRAIIKRMAEKKNERK